MDDLYAKLLESSFRFLSFRPRSEKEVRDFLLKKLLRRNVVDEGVVDRVLSRLRELGYIDDEKFSSWWIEQRHSHKPKGARLIAQELKAKGIKSQYSYGGRNVTDTDDEAVLARRAVIKKLPLWQKLPKLAQKKKIYGFLARRGFDGGVIRRVIDEVTGGEVEYP